MLDGCAFIVEFEPDEEEGNGKKWIECDDCTAKMHVSCIAMRHKLKYGIEDDSRDT